MNSGVYKLLFSDGSFYIGKSNNLDRRMKEHGDKLIKGTHAKALQATFDRCGPAEFYVIMECHEDHIDILEGYFIHFNINNPKCLNTARPCPPSEDLCKILDVAPSAFWRLSTAHHYHLWQEQINKLGDEIAELEGRLSSEIGLRKKMQKPTYVGELEQSLELERSNLKYVIQDRNDWKEKYNKLLNRGFFARLFNWGD